MASPVSFFQLVEGHTCQLCHLALSSTQEAVTDAFLCGVLSRSQSREAGQVQEQHWPGEKEGAS